MAVCADTWAVEDSRKQTDVQIGQGKAQGTPVTTAYAPRPEPTVDSNPSKRPRTAAAAPAIPNGAKSLVCDYHF